MQNNPQQACLGSEFCKRLAVSTVLHYGILYCILLPEFRRTYKHSTVVLMRHHLCLVHKRYHYWSSCGWYSQLYGAGVAKPYSQSSKRRPPSGCIFVRSHALGMPCTYKPMAWDVLLQGLHAHRCEADKIALPS